MLNSRMRALWALVIAAVLCGAVMIGFRDAEAPPVISSPPPGTQSVQVQTILESAPDADEQPVIVVARSNNEELTREQLADIALLGPRLTDIGGAEAEAVGPIPSEDGTLALLIVPMRVSDDNTVNADVIGDMRADIDDASSQSQALQAVELYVTGGPAFGADIASAFDGANFTLLAVTVVIIAVLLIITYRSPVLWLVPIIVVALADRVAALLSARAATLWDLDYNSGILSVLVFGAGSNYALLLISRYREELARHENHYEALARAWRGCLTAILASNISVVLALLTLALASTPSTRGLGIVAALGLIVALLAVLFVLPPALALVGRGAFWPAIPKVGHSPRASGLWERIARGVAARPALSFVGGVAILAVLASGLFGTSVGLSQTERFRVSSESAEGLEVLSEQFPPGLVQPITVLVTDGSHDEATSAILANVDGVEEVAEGGPPVSTPDGATYARLTVRSQYEPGTDAALNQVSELRSTLAQLENADGLVGGATAEDFDSRQANIADLMLIAPLILLVCLIVLVVVLRSIVAPLLVLAINSASSLAAIGAGVWLSQLIFSQSALDQEVPLLAFLFLVALGIDYTIFLTHRARSEAIEHGTRDGMVRAVSATGGVITSAGVLLAGVFAALGVLPLVTLGQIGLIVGVGVVMDTFIVRAVIVPALFAIVGPRMWWPTHPGPGTAEPRREWPGASPQVPRARA